MPWLCLKGVSSNDFGEALEALFGGSVKGLSATTMMRMKRVWEEQHAEWRERDWHRHEFVYLWGRRDLREHTQGGAALFIGGVGL